MSTSFRIPWTRRLVRNLPRLPALIVWGAAVLGAGALYLRQEQELALTGVAAEVRYVVSPSAPGRLEQLEVSLGQDVAKGEVVASLDDRDLMLDLREARTEIKRLGLEIERETELLARDDQESETERLQALRRFARDVESAVLGHLEALAEQAEDRIRLQGLTLTLGRTKALVASETATRSTLDDDRTAHDALKKAIEARVPRIAELEARREKAEYRYLEFARTAPTRGAESEALLRPHRHAVEVQEIRLERVNREITKLVLRAPGAGRVAEILRRPGELAQAGEPVLSIVSPQAIEVVAWIPEDLLGEVRRGSRVRIRRAATTGDGDVSTIAVLGARLERLPERVDPMAVVPRWGLPVRIPLPPSLAARPGEAFEIELIGKAESLF